MSEVEEAKERAKKLLVDTGVRWQLLEFWLAVECFPSWSMRDAAFDERWNFGVTDICARAYAASGEKNVVASCGTFEGQRYAVAAYRYTVTMPDDDFSVCRLWFELDGVQVLDVKYEVEDEGIIPSHFSLFSVEELHWSDSLRAFLSRASQAIAEQKARRDARERAARDAKYEGKFTF